MELIINIFSLVGSLALFLFGMKTMSEGMEKFAGNRLRSILAAMTKNRVMGVLTGVLITALIQSSSATTVMVVSFVNAGLMTLAQSIGVIMGANIGTSLIQVAVPDEFFLQFGSQPLLQMLVILVIAVPMSPHREREGAAAREFRTAAPCLSRQYRWWRFRGRCLKSCRAPGGCRREYPPRPRCLRRDG